MDTIVRSKSAISSYSEPVSDCGKPRITRWFDVILTIIGGIFALPFILGIALIIKIDDWKSNIFYSQTRIGKGGKEFRALKFRTMVPDADKVLVEYLSRDPRLKVEWEAEHKLKNDPRVTRIGKFLRATSLDELPQLINILRGEMSLIGPRPIVEEEIIKYGKCFELYIQARPGLTGLWQVSGRNDTGYDQRVLLDEHYLRNWSLNLDLVILIKTVTVVLKRKGAY